MKKLLILLICGFAFTQSIQTKQVEVTITDWSDINLYELIENEIGGKYKIEVTDIFVNGSIEADWYPITLDLIDNEELANAYMNATASSYENYSIVFMASDIAYSFNSSEAYVDEYSQSISFDDNDNGYPIFTENSTISITFWVTGMFEDEGIGLQGDMNGDEMLNVVDVVSLVSAILGE